MKLSKLIDLRIFIVALVGSIFLGWVFHWATGLAFWISWISMVLAWIAVGVSTMVDDYDDSNAFSRTSCEKSASNDH